jgi:thioredoxin-related protein
MLRFVLGSLLVLLVPLAPAPAAAQVVAPHAIDIPPWFAQSFLELREDVREAAQDGKRLMLYFGQDGCPYCKALMRTNFSQRKIVAKTRQHFVALALNIWGDREVTWFDGRTMREKDLARFLKVQFTPTLMFFDEHGQVVARLNGYYPPHRFSAVLDWVSGRMEGKVPLAEYLRRNVRDAASESLHDEPFFMRAPYDLRRRPGAKPLAVLFETPFCSGCDELHREGFRRPEVKAELSKFDVARFSLLDRSTIIDPQGKSISAAEFARRLAVTYTPSIVFFDGAGREVFRIEAYLRPFHLAGSFEYVSSGAYRSQPSFQRFLQAKAERMRERGETVELWQ